MALRKHHLTPVCTRCLQAGRAASAEAEGGNPDDRTNRKGGHLGGRSVTLAGHAGACLSMLGGTRRAARGTWNRSMREGENSRRRLLAPPSILLWTPLFVSIYFLPKPHFHSFLCPLVLACSLRSAASPRRQRPRLRASDPLVARRAAIRRRPPKQPPVFWSLALRAADVGQRRRAHRWTVCHRYATGTNVSQRFSRFQWQQFQAGGSLGHFQPFLSVLGDFKKAFFTKALRRFPRYNCTFLSYFLPSSNLNNRQVCV